MKKTITILGEFDASGNIILNEEGKFEERIKNLISNSVGIHITPEILEQFTCYLLPIVSKSKIGFIDKKANIILPPIFDGYYGAFDSDKSFIKVKINNLWGIIDVTGSYILQPEYTIIYPVYKDVFVVSKEYKYGIIDFKGNVIVPFGKYDWIDVFDHDLARIKGEGGKWGIIDLGGNEFLPVIYDSIWNFCGKNRKFTRAYLNGTFRDVPLQAIHLQDNRNIEKFSEDDFSESFSSFDNPYFNENLDIDQQSMEFWDQY